jgi:vancomycin permeability regulator SanA
MLISILKWVAGVWLIISLIVASIGLLSKPQKSDIAVVFGNEVYADGSPSNRLSARLDRARQCYENGTCRQIFVSGGVDKHGTDEALAMENYLVRRGIPKEQIVMDNMGLDTWDTARNASAYMKTRHLESALVVTQYFHVPRAVIALKRFGIKYVSGSYPRFFEVRDIYSAIREAPAIIWYGVRTDF